MKTGRIISIILSLIIFAGVFSSCGFPGKKEETTAPPTTTAAPDFSVWKDKFEEYLLSVENRSQTLISYQLEPSECRFGIADFDGGATPELVISEGEYQGSKVDIIGYDGYELRLIGSAGAYGELKFIEGGNRIFAHDETEDQATDTVYSIENYVLKQQWEGVLFSDTNEGNTVRYLSDEEEVSEEEYNTLLSQNIPANATVFGRGATALTAENILNVMETGNVNVSGGETTTAAETEKPVSNAWKKAYREKAKEIAASGEYPEAVFGLFYIDGDDIPELVISKGSFHAAGVLIYSYRNDELITVSEGIGSYGGINYAAGKGVILTGDAYQSAETDIVYELKDGELKVLWTGEKKYAPEAIPDIDKPEHYYSAFEYVDDLEEGSFETTEDDYNAMYEKYVKAYDFTRIDREGLSEITDENFDKAFNA
ncbi:MAG: hypothetical protein IKH65_09910 [Clostridia bacterium]|nr:hypothetical protein [Clostridia bacterium]